MNGTVDAVGFDLDGTLYDDRQYVRAGFREAATVLEDRIGVNLYDEFVDAYFNRGIRERTFDRVLEENGYSTNSVPELVKAYHGCSPELELFPGAQRTLEVLKGTYRLGLVTGGTNGQWKVGRLGLTQYFDATVVTPEINATKTEPEPFERLLQELGVTPNRTVFVGDRPELDIVVPNRLGMWTVLIGTGHYESNIRSDDARPDATIEQLTELPRVLRTL